MQILFTKENCLYEFWYEEQMFTVIESESSGYVSTFEHVFKLLHRIELSYHIVWRRVSSRAHIFALGFGMEGGVHVLLSQQHGIQCEREVFGKSDEDFADIENCVINNKSKAQEKNICFFSLWITTSIIFGSNKNGFAARFPHKVSIIHINISIKIRFISINICGWGIRSFGLMIYTLTIIELLQLYLFWVLYKGKRDSLQNGREWISYCTTAQNTILSST